MNPSPSNNPDAPTAPPEATKPSLLASIDTSDSNLNSDIVHELLQANPSKKAIQGPKVKFEDYKSKYESTKEIRNMVKAKLTEPMASHQSTPNLAALTKTQLERIEFLNQALNTMNQNK